MGQSSGAENIPLLTDWVKACAQRLFALCKNRPQLLMVMTREKGECIFMVAARGVAIAFALVCWAVVRPLLCFFGPRSTRSRRFSFAQSLPPELATKTRKAAGCCFIMILP
jgi:hypothetical protein